MKLISWNVNGLRACAGKDEPASLFAEDNKQSADNDKITGFRTAFAALDADFFCLQETKMQAGQLDLQFAGYKSYWNYAEKKGYSGTAIYTRHEPDRVYYGMGEVDADGEIAWNEDSVHNHEGRVITLEYGAGGPFGEEGAYVITVYVPNAQDGLRRLDYRMEWEDAFLRYIQALDKKRPVIFCGDLNVAHQEIDLKNPKTNRMNPGFTDEERGKFTDLLSAGFTDTFRALYPEEIKYSWWSYRFHAREKNTGWRIDYFVCSNRLMPKVSSATIHNEVYGSDHCPVGLCLVE